MCKPKAFSVFILFLRDRKCKSKRRQWRKWVSVNLYYRRSQYRVVRCYCQSTHPIHHLVKGRKDFWGKKIFDDNHWCLKSSFKLYRIFVDFTLRCFDLLIEKILGIYKFFPNFLTHRNNNCVPILATSSDTN